jgi:hypothetical protein
MAKTKIGVRWLARAVVAVLLALVGCESAKDPARPSSRTEGSRLGQSERAGRVVEQVRAIVSAEKSSVWQSSRASGVVAFERANDRVKPLLDSSTVRRSRAPAHVELPGSADGDVTIVDRGSQLGVSFRVLGAPPAGIEATGELAVYDSPIAQRVWVQRVHAEGLEDYVLFRKRPERAELRYRIDVSRVAGLRLISHVLEFLDRDGTPRLAVAQPYVVDSTGVRHDATLELSGCAYDADPRMPWGRPVRAPGASHCELVVRWPDDGLSYPVVLDPAWSTTCSLRQTPPAGARMVRMQDGRVLLQMGGRGAIFDPTSGTWSLTQAGPVRNNSPWPPYMSYPFEGDDMVVLNDGRVLTPTGYYEPSTGRWTVAVAPGSINADGRPIWASGTLTALLDGRAVLTGRFYPGGPGDERTMADSGASLFDPNTSTWSEPSGDGLPTEKHAAVRLPDGRVLLAGGTEYDCLWIDDERSCFGMSRMGAVIYSPTTGTFSTAAPMLKGRFDSVGVLLPSGKVLVAGEIANDHSAEIYDPLTNTWRALNAQLKSGELLLTPEGNVFVASAEPTVFETDTERWFALPNYIDSPRPNPAAALLPNGAVLIAGAPWPTAEIYQGGRLGAACASDAECSSGHCVDHVCCDRACTGLCEACSVVKKGAGTVEGRCSPILEGADPENECAPVGSGVCKKPGYCDGGGACKNRAGTSCGTTRCAYAIDELPDYPDADMLVGFRDVCNDSGFCDVGIAYLCEGPGFHEPGRCPEDCTTRWQLPPPPPPPPPGTKALGEPCVRGSECASYVCADGVCCNTGCGACQACRSELKQDGPDGVCGPVKPKTDPHQCCGEALFSADNSCLLGTGVCDGNGACEKKNRAGAPCGETTCGDGTTISGKVCNENGYCVDGSASCGPFACSNGMCGICCGSASDCAPGFVCRNCDCVLDADAEPSDAGSDAKLDASADVTIDAAVDAQLEASADGAIDTGSDAKLDASADVRIDAAREGGVDASSDGASDAGHPRDSGADSRPLSDSGADSSPEPPPPDRGCTTCAIGEDRSSLGSAHAWLALLVAMGYIGRRRKPSYSVFRRTRRAAASAISPSRISKPERGAGPR